jgi:hypothetical protein
MSIFNTEFYPTPESVIRKMIAPYMGKLSSLQILEPSAGNGAILDYITNSYMMQKCKKENVYAIELNQELVFILQGKGYKILADDFLTYKPLHSFNLIVMNPPFSNGDEHLLHAWDIMHTGDIVCLLNAETIRNPYTQRRKLLKQIIEQNGEVEYLGNCFKTASRKTDVDVAMVRLHKAEEDKRWHIDFGNDAKMDVDPDFSEAVSAGSEIAINDKLGSYLHAWQKAQEAAIEFIKARKKLDFYVTAFMNTEDVSKLVSEQLGKYKDGANDMQAAYNVFLNTAKSKAWKEIICNLGMDKYMTANLRNTFDQFCEAQGAYELNRENIYKLVQFVCLNSQNIMKKAVADVFDTFCKFHKDNAVHTEGWKTNSQFKVNKKVILPGFVSAGYNWQRFGCNKYYTTEYGRYREYEDIDKVMCYLSGISYDSMDKLKDGADTSYNARRSPEDYEHLSLQKAISFVTPGDSSLHESEFFMFRCFKKGTLHIIFKSDDLWARFNLTVNEGKRMLGHGK